MTITFNGNQYFHPVYGWIDKDRPDLVRQNAPIALPAGNLRALTQDNVNEVLGQDIDLEALVKMMAEVTAENALNSITKGEMMPNDYYEKNISVHPYKGVQGYQFNYSGNALTVRIEDSLVRNSPIDIFRDYEQHRQNIEDLKRHGYNDEAISMLLNELDSKLLKASSAGLATQLWGKGFSDRAISSIFQQLAREYLSLRNSGVNYERTAEMAVNNLEKRGVLPKGIDVYWGKHGEIGRLQESINKKMAAIEAPYKAALDSFQPIASAWVSQSQGFKFDIAQTHILSLQASQLNDWNSANISDEEKEARNNSIIFRVRGTALADYGKRYEEISSELDKRLRDGEISAADYSIYSADLDKAFINTQNLNIVGQAMSAGLSEEKADELARGFSIEYINIRNQLSSNDIDSEKIANMALLKISSNGWPAFSLYSTENRATAKADDPWYAIMAENALYYANQITPQWYNSN